MNMVSSHILCGIEGLSARVPSSALNFVKLCQNWIFFHPASQAVDFNE